MRQAGLRDALWIAEPAGETDNETFPTHLSYLVLLLHSFPLCTMSRLIDEIPYHVCLQTIFDKEYQMLSSHQPLLVLFPLEPHGYYCGRNFRHILPVAAYGLPSGSNHPLHLGCFVFFSNHHHISLSFLLPKVSSIQLDSTLCCND